MTQALITARVRLVRDEAIDVKIFEFDRSDGGALPEFTPGAHIDVYLPEGWIRQYSLCNGPDERGFYRIAVKKEPASRGGSRTMHDDVRKGDLLQIGAPRNNFRLVEDSDHVVLIAAGIGITPLLSMALHLIHNGRSFELHCFSRSAEHTAYRQLLSSPEFLDKTVFHLGLDAEQVDIELRRILGHRSPNSHLYLCGPGAFMDLVEKAAKPIWPLQNVHLEHFGAAPGLDCLPKDEFTIRLAHSGIEFVVARGQSVIEALAEHGVMVDTSCEQGVCGTCLTRVLEGIPDHRDVFLTDGEKTAGDQMCLCVSRAKSSVLVLDL